MAADLTPEAAMRQHRGAACLAIYNGRTRLGTVIDTRRQERRALAAPSYAFDPDHRFVGSFACRRDAVGALAGATR